MCSCGHYETPSLNPASQMPRILYFGLVINLLFNFSHMTRFLSDVVVHLVSDNQLIIFYLNVFIFCRRAWGSEVSWSSHPLTHVLRVARRDWPSTISY